MPELVRDAFGKAASGLLQFANTRFCLRRVLQETLTRIETNRSDPTSEPACPQLGWDVADDRYTGMVMLLRSPRLGTSEQSLTAVFSFLGQLEYFCKGRLWARYQAKRVLDTPQAPMLLCCLARDVPSRVELLATKVFNFSVIFREPFRRFFDSDWQGYVLAASGIDPSDRAARKGLRKDMCISGLTGSGFAARAQPLSLHDHMRAICTLLLPAAIRLPGYRDGSSF